MLCKIVLTRRLHIIILSFQEGSLTLGNYPWKYSTLKHHIHQICTCCQNNWDAMHIKVNSAELDHINAQQSHSGLSCIMWALTLSQVGLVHMCWIFQMCRIAFFSKHADEQRINFLWDAICVPSSMMQWYIHTSVVLTLSSGFGVVFAFFFG